MTLHDTTALYLEKVNIDSPPVRRAVRQHCVFMEPDHELSYTHGMTQGQCSKGGAPFKRSHYMWYVPFCKNEPVCFKNRS